MKIKTIIFSRDRAMQVDAVLRSFFLHCQDAAETAQVHVIYKATSARHAAQYEQLAHDYPLVNFVRQSNFRADTLRLLDPYPANHLLYRLMGFLGALGFRVGTRPDRFLRRFADVSRHRLIRALLPHIAFPRGILFLVDDNLFVQDFSLQPVLSTLAEHGDVLGFSLRLGRNTTYCYSADQPQPTPPFFAPASGLLKFNWLKAGYDFGYPLEVSSSVYLDVVIAPFLVSVPFGNPNELESAMASRTNVFRKSHPALLCFEQSVTFCNPVNLVQSFHPNRAGEQYPYGVDDLLESFERGERIDVQAYSGFAPNACHQEVPLHFFKQLQYPSSVNEYSSSY